MTDTMNPADETADDASGAKLKVLLTALFLAVGLSVLVTLWWRRGGPRAAITELAEQGAVRLADKVVDEILGAAA